MGTGSVTTRFCGCFRFADGACPLFRTVIGERREKRGTGTSRQRFSPHYRPISARSQSPFFTPQFQFEG